MEAIKLLDEYAQALGCEIRKDVPMRDYTTFKIGGACERLVEPSSVEQISGVLAFCREHGIPLTLVAVSYTHLSMGMEAMLDTRMVVTNSDG